MAIQSTSLAPQSMIPPERRGAVQGKFCKTCATVFPLQLGRHAGKGVNGHDHIASSCAHEGDTFAAGALWWEPAVVVLPAPPPPPVAAAPAAPLAR
ncbi:MAG: hypothetical protein ABI609_08625 [Acidobacteriota bacterium]